MREGWVDLIGPSEIKMVILCALYVSRLTDTAGLWSETSVFKSGTRDYSWVRYLLVVNTKVKVQMYQEIEIIGQIEIL